MPLESKGLKVVVALFCCWTDGLECTSDDLQDPSRCLNVFIHAEFTSSSSSRVRVINHNLSARKQHLHLSLLSAEHSSSEKYFKSISKERAQISTNEH